VDEILRDRANFPQGNRPPMGDLRE